MTGELFSKLLDGAGDRPTWQELADVLWLARHLAQLPPAPPDDGTAAPPVGRPSPRPLSLPEAVAPPDQDAPRVDRGAPHLDGTTPRLPRQGGLSLPGRAAGGGSVPLRVPTPPALRDALALRRALRPLGRGAPPGGRRGRALPELELDEEATVDRVAATGFKLPVLRPAPIRWLDVALVVDDSVSMRVWDRAVEEFRVLLRTAGTFRSVQDWTLLSEESRSRGIVLRRGIPASAVAGDRSPGELVDPTGRRIVLVVSDCIGPAWTDGTLAQLLGLWGRSGPVAVVQPLPRRLWERTTPSVRHVRLRAPGAGAANTRLVATSPRGSGPPATGMPVPVLMLDPRSLGPWASLTSGESQEFHALAMLVDGAQPAHARGETDAQARSADELVHSFRAVASPAAWKLAVYLSAVPLSQPVMRIVQEVMISDPQPAQLAEVLLSGLLMRAEDIDGARGDDIRFEFRPGVRELLLNGLTQHAARRLLQLTTEYIADHHGVSVDFQAVLDGDDLAVARLGEHRPFAEASARVLRRLGAYTAVAQRLETVSATPGPPDDAPAAVLRVRGTPPPPADRPFGREALLKDLHTALTADGAAPQVLVAPEGGGATAVALDYVRVHGGEAESVVWLSAGTPAVGGHELARLAGTVAGRADEGAEASWLLVLDGAASVDALPALPTGSGRVLITSASPAWPEGFAVQRLPAPARGTGIRIARRHAPALIPSQARRLAERLDDSPLALEVAATFLSVTGESPDAYLERLGPRDGAAQAADPAGTACRISLSHVLGEHPQARDVLHRLAVLAPGPVPVPLLTPGTSQADETLAVLVRHALLRAGAPADGLVFVHPVVQRVCRDRMTQGEATVARRAVRARMVDHFGRDEPDDPVARPRFAALTRHLEPADALGEKDPSVRDLVQRQLRHLHACGDLTGCRALGVLALRQLADRVGHDDPAVTALAALLGSLLPGTRPGEEAPLQPGAQ
ncbi:SAV_2336 N-terminal domain-related protein [Streptomyces sp. Marseille-Q5077]|uniref:SAV_2336 N-terminal domain-related protein n=1 Tax=Streptomyces sp. Marseille-Q5077 TaxID=3418995 RepID=UPI003D061C23